MSRRIRCEGLDGVDAHCVMLTGGTNSCRAAFNHPDERKGQVMIRHLLAVPAMRVQYLAALALACICSAWSVSALAELNEVSLARQFGDSYLPLMLMERQKLIEKHAQKLGLADVKAIWKEVSGGNAANDALLSGNLHFVSGGLGPLLQAWSASAGRIKGVAALNTMPLLLNTNNPNVKSIRDFTDKDRIAVPAVRVSMQSVVLRMAAAKEFGEKDFDRLDRLTVTMTQA